MKLNLAVYTAVEGYSWQTGTKISNNDLIEYKRIIGCFPDPTVDIIPFGGAFLCRNKAVFYRFHIAKQADSKGRDALYLVLGVCDKEMAKMIDFKVLFALPELSAVNTVFPTELNYIGGVSASTDVNFGASFNKGYSRKEDLSLIGAFLSNCPNDNLLIKISGGEAAFNMMVSYKATPISSVKAVAPIENNVKTITAKPNFLNKENSFSSTYKPIEVQDEVKFGAGGALMIITAVAFLIVGILIGYFLRGILADDEKSLPAVTNYNVQEIQKSKDDFNKKMPEAKPINNEINQQQKPKRPIFDEKIIDPGESKPAVTTNQIPNNRDKDREINPITEKPQNKPCFDCGVAIVGCEKCRRSGIYRGRICFNCNGTGQIEELRLCPKHRNPIVRNETNNSNQKLKTQDKITDESKDNIVNLEDKQNPNDVFKQQNNKISDAQNKISEKSKENVNE